MKKPMTAIGLMSGTSLDGLDIAYCSFSEQDGNWDYEIVAASCIDYDDHWLDRLSSAHDLTGLELTALNTDLGRFMAQQVNQFLEERSLPAPDLIASHGHTVFHAPDRSFTLQVGCGAQIAAATGITTVSDFRSLDVALGGQGAPLVPIGDRMLFGNYGACLNLGGFSNISFEKDGGRRAMDICPVNIMLNPLAQRLGHDFDRGGALAAQGQVLPELLLDLDALDVYQSEKRPSLSREWTETSVWPLMPTYADPIDLLRTVTEHAARQMARVLNSTGAEDVLVTGGGAYNSFLIERLASQCKATPKLPDARLIAFKEALIFALLGVLRLRGDANVLRSVTGASRDSCSGAVHLISL
jgi:anhydro-N-acetylmuramic acid kinase